MANKKSKINLGYGYSLTIREDDTITVVTTDKDGESIEIDGKDGILMVASDMETWFDDELEEETLEELLYNAREFFADWGVEAAVAEAIVKELTPWFERHAISKDKAMAKEIAKLEERISYRRETISRKMESIGADHRLIEGANNRIKATAEEAVMLNREVNKYEERIAELKAQLNGEKFISVEPCYTGGGVYIFTGKLADGNYFMADTSFFDVRIVNADPDEPIGNGEVKMDSVEWQEEHLVKDLTPAEAVAFYGQMLKWVKENEPNGNYDMGDMERITEELDTLQGDWR